MGSSDSDSVVSVVVDSDGGAGGGSDRRGARYYVRGSYDSVTELTPSLTGGIPLNGH